MLLDVDDATISLAQSAVYAALNWRCAQAEACARGPKAAMKRLHGRVVLGLPRSQGVVVQRPMLLGTRRGDTPARRRRSGRSNWAAGSKEERMAELARRAAARLECARVAELARMTKEAAKAAKACDGGTGPYALASPAQRYALWTVRERVAAAMGIDDSNKLTTRAAAAVSLVAPAAVPAFESGMVVAVDESLPSVSPGATVEVHRDESMCQFHQPGACVALTFARPDQLLGS